MNYENIDLLVIGDSGVGKSTFINTYLTQQFRSVPSGILKSNIQISGTEYGCTNININLTDTTSKYDDHIFQQSILNSACILLICSWDIPQSMNRMENYVLPLIIKLCAYDSIPILIAINKSDKFGELNDIRYMNEYVRHQLCLRWQSYHKLIKNVFQSSCLNIMNVSIVIDTAIQLMLYPLQCLIVIQERVNEGQIIIEEEIKANEEKNDMLSGLKSNENNDGQTSTTKIFEIALRRIFYILDRDCNLLLTDDEILFYYRECLTLTSMEMNQIQKLKNWLLSLSHSENTHNLQNKQRIRMSEFAQSYIEMDDEFYNADEQKRYISQKCITFGGFVQLHLLLIQTFQHQCIWKSLQKFGYQRKKLILNESFFVTLPKKSNDLLDYCLFYNPFTHSEIKAIQKKKCPQLQFELHPNICGFLMDIFLKHCCFHQISSKLPVNRRVDNAEDEELNAYYIQSIPRHDFDSCYLTNDKLRLVLQQFCLPSLPFTKEDYIAVGCESFSESNEYEYKSTLDLESSNVKIMPDTLSLTSWISLWSMCMSYESNIAMKYLSMMGAPTVLPMPSFTPQWTDYFIPQYPCSKNCHQRYFRCLVVSYPVNTNIVQNFIRSSVFDFSFKSYANENESNEYNDGEEYLTRHCSQTSELSPILEAQNINRHDQEIEYKQQCLQTYPTPKQSIFKTNDIFNRITTVLTMKLYPKGHISGNRYSYGICNDYQQQNAFYAKYSSNVKKLIKDVKYRPLIPITIMNKNRAMDAYNIEMESWSNSNQLFSNDKNSNLLKSLSNYDCIIYLHSNENISSYANIRQLFCVGRDLKLPIITVLVPDEMNGIQHQSRNDFHITKDDVGHDSDDDVMDDILTETKGCLLTNGTSIVTEVEDVQELILLGDTDDATQGADDITIVELNADVSVIDIDVGNDITVEQSSMGLQQLQQIFNEFDVPSNVQSVNQLIWTSFAEDQHRFNQNLARNLHYRQLYIPKTFVQKLANTSIYYGRQLGVLLFGTAVLYYVGWPSAKRVIKLAIKSDAKSVKQNSNLKRKKHAIDKKTEISVNKNRAKSDDKAANTNPRVENRMMEKIIKNAHQLPKQTVNERTNQIIKCGLLLTSTVAIVYVGYKIYFKSKNFLISKKKIFDESNDNGSKTDGINGENNHWTNFFFSQPQGHDIASFNVIQDEEDEKDDGENGEEDEMSFAYFGDTSTNK